MTISSLGPTDSSSYYTSISSGASSTNALSGSGLPTQDSINLQLDSSLLQSLSQSNMPANETADYPTNIQQTVEDDEILATNANLAQTVSQLDTSLDLPTNIQQTVEDQVIQATDTNIAQMVSQQIPSPLTESQTEALQTLQAENETGQADQSLTSLAASMQMLQNITSTGVLASNASLAQSLMQNYTILTNPASLGSLVDTSA